MTKKILIIGDSWGTGAWKYGDKNTKVLEDTILIPNVEGFDRFVYHIPNTGLDYCLRQLGYDVTNVSIPGCGNFLQLTLIDEAVKNNGPFDYIVWFHTEINRDILHIIVRDRQFIHLIPPDLLDAAIAKGTYWYADFDSTTYEGMLDYVQNQNYKFAKDIYYRHKIPFIVLGCLSPITDHVENYPFIHTLYKSWITELTGISVPRNMHTEYLVKILDKFGRPRDSDFVLSEINKMTETNAYLEQHKAFSEGVHPGTESLKTLANSLTKIL